MRGRRSGGRPSTSRSRPGHAPHDRRQLAEAIRAEQPGLPIILATGYAEQPGGDVGLPRLVKPFRQDALARAVADAVCTEPATGRMLKFRAR